MTMSYKVAFPWPDTSPGKEKEESASRKIRAVLRME
jgi:hypothetical protein